MAKNGISRDNRRIGAVKNRTQIFKPKTNLYVKRDNGTGQFMAVKITGGKFKGITEKK